MKSSRELSNTLCQKARAEKPVMVKVTNYNDEIDKGEGRRE